MGDSGRIIVGSMALALLFVSNLLTAPVGMMTNCTGGEADLALLPVFLVPALASASVLAVLRPRRKIGLFVAAALLPLILTANTLVRVAQGWFGHGRTACQTLLDGPYPADGNEALTPYMLAAVALIVLLSAVSRIPCKN